MTAKKSLEKKAKKGFRGYPVVSIGFYGPTNKLATKVAVGFIEYEDAEPIMTRWYSETDIRFNEKILKEISNFIRDHEAKSVAMMGKIIGCPHEEGIDYPVDQCCPECPFWANRDRWSD
ncbi:MAG: hypothetical protein ACYCQI_04460 [Gammaproteobacteria bacterium]